MDAARPERPPIAYLDPGWLFLLAGLGILAATILLPALQEVDEVRLERDRILAAEEHRKERNQRYDTYLAALKREEPALVMALAASQLNQIPQGRTLALIPPDLLASSARADASVFPALEPPPLVLPDAQPTGSMLARLTTGDRTRPWLIAIGGLLVLIGLLPAARTSLTPR